MRDPIDYKAADRLLDRYGPVTPELRALGRATLLEWVLAGSRLRVRLNAEARARVAEDSAKEAGRRIMEEAP
jgi:hypothetical protein